MGRPSKREFGAGCSTAVAVVPISGGGGEVVYRGDYESRLLGGG